MPEALRFSRARMLEFVVPEHSTPSCTVLQVVQIGNQTPQSLWARGHTLHVCLSSAGGGIVSCEASSRPRATQRSYLRRERLPQSRRFSGATSPRCQRPSPSRRPCLRVALCCRSPRGLRTRCIYFFCQPCDLFMYFERISSTQNKWSLL